MPKPINYRTDSIVYFKGDQDERIFILKSGKVRMNSTDIETGQEIHELVQTGEFFGVKSALGKYPREETVMVLQDSEVVAFSVAEFEQMASANTRIIMKMLKVFSNQLRRIQKQVQNLLATGEQVDPEQGLFSIGDYYLKNRKYKQALYALRQYLTYYPAGKNAPNVNQLVQQAEHAFSQYGQGKGPNPSVPTAPTAEAGPAAKAVPRPDAGATLDGAAKRYYDAVSLFSQDRYEDALKSFSEIIKENADEEYVGKSQYEAGRCFYNMKQYDKCVAFFTQLVKQAPNHPEMADILYVIGECYEEKKENERAVAFYRKILSMTAEDDTVNRKARKALKKITGA